MKWEETIVINPGPFTAARLELHCGALILGSVAHSLLTNTDDDNHASLDYVAEHRSLATRVLCAQPAIALHLDLVTNTLVFRKHNDALASFDLSGQTIAQALAWLRSKSVELMGTQTTIAQREYADLPVCPPLAGGRYAPVAAENAQIARWFQNAHSLLDNLRTPGSPMSEIRVWPHHFDLGAVLPVRVGSDRAIGLGMSPGDHYHDQPYFYCSPDPVPVGTRLPDLALGHWHTEGFTSAVLTAKELQDAAPPTGDAAARYLAQAVAACRVLVA